MDEKHYGPKIQTKTLRKRSGGKRVVYVPPKSLRVALRRLLPRLQKIARSMDTRAVMHGFMYRRSFVTNAIPHIGFAITLSFDIKDFFDSVTVDHIPKKVLKSLGADAPWCFHDGIARQGFPTSPVLANIAMAKFDNEMVSLLAKRAVYTRYADDLSFSFNDENMIEWLMDMVPRLLAKYGFSVNHRKTHLQRSIAGRRIICGVAVSDAIYPRREWRRRLRAAKHQNNVNQARGLEEVMKLKVPMRTISRRKQKSLISYVKNVVAKGDSKRGICDLLGKAAKIVAG